MLVRGAMIVWAMAVTLLPVTPAPAAEAAPGAQSPAIENVKPTAAPAPAPTVAAENVPLDARPGGLVYTLDEPAPATRPEGLRFDFDQRPASTSPLRLSPASSAARSGWAVSGRAGPLRWLTALDGESGTTMRLGGRVADQPRTPGMGLFNMSLHYRFE